MPGTTLSVLTDYGRTLALAGGERGYWMDHAASGPRYGAYISHDLVSTIDHDYRTLASREARAIGGMSMGGHGALVCALRNPDRFRSVSAFAPIVAPPNQYLLDRVIDDYTSICGSPLEGPR